MLKIKVGDEIVIISGNNKGKKGVVKKISKNKHRAIIRNINIITKHIKPTNQKPSGRIVKIEAPIHISNLALVDPINKLSSKVGFKFDKGKKFRFLKKSGYLLKDIKDINDTNKN